MIKVNLKELAYYGNDNAEKLKTSFTNTAARQYQKVLAEKLKNRECKNHPEMNSIVTVVAKNDKVFQVEKTSFCCDEFKNQFQFETV